MNNYLDIFKRSKCDFSRLSSYGFIKEGDIFKYTHFLIDNLIMDIIIDMDGKVSFKVTDLIFNEEYVNYKIENQVGEYVSRVREEINNILCDIKTNCFTNKFFIYDQSNRITKLIKDKYGDDPLFLWKDDDKDGVFKNPSSDKWYGIIMNVNSNKLTKESKDCEVLNVKLDPDKIKKLIKKKGYYECYHMSKKYWLSIILDDTLNDSVIMDLISESHKYTEITNNWLLPANNDIFNVIEYFDKTNEIIWEDTHNIKKNDYVYLYVTKPYSAILFKLVVDSANENELLFKLVEKYPLDKYKLDVLKKYGVKSVRGARRVPTELYNFIEK